jgi:predicted nucleotidyltransferase
VQFPKGLDPTVSKTLEDFLTQCQSTLGADLAAAALFGSAAEGRLRSRSDVNLVVVLKTWPQEKLQSIREAYVFAKAAIDLNALFVLDSELPSVAVAFAVKFDDIAHRHWPLLGADIFSDLAPDRPAMLARLRQVCLNLRLRLREAWLEGGDLGRELVDAAGPLRSAAATLARLQGKDIESGRQALQGFCETKADPALKALPQSLSQLRETGTCADLLGAFNAAVKLTLLIENDLPMAGRV